MSVQLGLPFGGGGGGGRLAVLENMQWEYFEPMKEEATGGNTTMRTSVICTLHW